MIELKTKAPFEVRNRPSSKVIPKVGSFVKPNTDAYQITNRKSGYIGVVADVLDGYTLRVIGIYDNDYNYDQITAIYDLAPELVDPYFPTTAELCVFHDYLMVSKAFHLNEKECDTADKFVLNSFDEPK